MKHNHRASDLTIPVVDRSRGIFDRAFMSISTNEHTVRRQPHGPVFPNGQFQWIGNGPMGSTVDDLKYFAERMTLRLRGGPSRHGFGDDVQIGHVARDIGAQYSV